MEEINISISFRYPVIDWHYDCELFYFVLFDNAYDLMYLKQAHYQLLIFLILYSKKFYSFFQKPLTKVFIVHIYLEALLNKRMYINNFLA